MSSTDGRSGRPMLVYASHVVLVVVGVVCGTVGVHHAIGVNLATSGHCSSVVGQISLLKQTTNQTNKCETSKKKA